MNGSIGIVKGACTQVTVEVKEKKSAREDRELYTAQAGSG